MSSSNKKTTKEKQQIYCGNNSRHSSVRNGEKIIGTPYTCLRKGFGVGLYLPYDPEFARRFVPIDKRKIYCGTEDDLPDGYDIKGSNSMCFRKGVGAGRAEKANKIRKNQKPKKKPAVKKPPVKKPPVKKSPAKRNVKQSAKRNTKNKK